MTYSREWKTRLCHKVFATRSKLRAPHTAHWIVRED